MALEILAPWRITSKAMGLSDSHLNMGYRFFHPLMKNLIFSYNGHNLGSPPLTQVEEAPEPQAVKPEDGCTIPNWSFPGALNHDPWDFPSTSINQAAEWICGSWPSGAEKPGGSRSPSGRRRTWPIRKSCSDGDAAVLRRWPPWPQGANWSFQTYCDSQ